MQADRVSAPITADDMAYISAVLIKVAVSPKRWHHIIRRLGQVVVTYLTVICGNEFPYGFPVSGLMEAGPVVP